MKNETVKVIEKVGLFLIGVSGTLLLLGILFPSVISTDKMPLWGIIPAVFGLVFLWYCMIFWLCKMIGVRKEINKLRDFINRHNSN